MRSRRLIGLLLVPLVCLASSIEVGRSSGQEPSAEKLPPPQDVPLQTKDGVKLVATYLASTKGKDAAVAILLHMFKGNRHDMEGLGQYLQKRGHAVIMPDLRGHGDSTTVVTPDGKERKLEAATMPATQFPLMIAQDLEVVKKFLVEENNAARLNIEKLCLVGAEMSVPIAIGWAFNDWQWPILPTLKQGQDVKALVLLSPTISFKTINAAQAFNNPKSPIRDRISVLFVVGAEDQEGVREARRLYSQLERIRPKPEKIEEKTVFIEDSLKTKLVGTKLLGEASLGVEQLIDQFIDLRLVRQLYPWNSRKAP